VGWNEVDLAKGEVRVIVDPVDYFTIPIEALNRHIHEHPVVEYVTRTGDGSAVKFSDFLSAREYHRREIYADFFQPLGVEDQLATLIEVQSPMIGVAFNRDRRSFTERDRTLLNLLRPHLASAHANLQTRAADLALVSALERGLELEGEGVVVLRNDRIDAASQEGQRILERWFGGMHPPIPLMPSLPITYERDEVRLTIRLVEREPIVLLLQERRLSPSPQHASLLGLTARETEVMRFVARGRSDAEIADALVVSVRTVQKHLEHVFTKLRVQTRELAVTRLLGDPGN